MHWESFYVEPDHVTGEELTFSMEETHHLRVLRKKVGEKIWAVDGEGCAFEAEIMKLGSEARARIVKTRRRLGEPVADITIAPSILKGDRLDWLVEKATELGVRRIIPMITANTAPAAAAAAVREIDTRLTVPAVSGTTAGEAEPGASASAGQQKTGRWRRIALAAMKQSGRTVLPEIEESRPVARVLSMGTGWNYRIIAVLGRGAAGLYRTIGDPPGQPVKALVLIGPEAGFTDEEVALSEEQGFKPVSLGPRRLKAETAGIVLLTQLFTILGELE